MGDLGFIIVFKWEMFVGNCCLYLNSFFFMGVYFVVGGRMIYVIIYEVKKVLWCELKKRIVVMLDELK